MINVTIWNEFRHEKQQDDFGAKCRSFYPNGIHAYLQEALQAEDLNIRIASLDEPEQGLPQELLESTDVLLWWGHAAHLEVCDKLVDRIQDRILRGMGLVALHSAHKSKILMRMTGTTCNLSWREIGERERVWTIAPSHPIAAGVPRSFSIPATEMYGEPFDIPDDCKVVFGSWYQGGNIFRSGLAFQRGAGKIFYFAPGHESFPIYHQPEVQKIIANAIRWAAPATPVPAQLEGCPHQQELPEPF